MYVPEQNRQRAFTVVMIAGRSTDESMHDLESLFDWQAAIIASATAILERGGTIVVPANTELAHLVASIALPYSEPHAAEQNRASARVQVVETSGDSAMARDELAPFAHRNAITYHDAENRVVRELPTVEAVPELPAETPGRRAHHPITPRLMEEFQPIGVVVVSNTLELEPELQLLRDMQVSRVAVLAPTAQSNDWARGHDPTQDMLRELGDNDDGGPIPYDIVAEMLVDRWLEATA